MAQAWANVEVELMRRNDLIPALVSIVTGLRDYESKAQTELAQLRKQLQATAPGRAGPDPEACAPLLLAIAEAYPELTAGEAFLNLQEELVRTEERLALARAYYNEIATFCNIRQQIIPGPIRRPRSPSFAPAHSCRPAASPGPASKLPSPSRRRLPGGLSAAVLTGRLPLAVAPSEPAPRSRRNAGPPPSGRPSPPPFPQVRRVLPTFDQRQGEVVGVIGELAVVHPVHFVVEVIPSAGVEVILGDLGHRIVRAAAVDVLHVVVLSQARAAGPVEHEFDAVAGRGEFVAAVVAQGPAEPPVFTAHVDQVDVWARHLERRAQGGARGQRLHLADRAQIPAQQVQGMAQA